MIFFFPKKKEKIKRKILTSSPSSIISKTFPSSLNIYTCFPEQHAKYRSFFFCDDSILELEKKEKEKKRIITISKPAQILCWTILIYLRG